MAHLLDFHSFSTLHEWPSSTCKKQHSVSNKHFRIKKLEWPKNQVSLESQGISYKCICLCRYLSIYACSLYLFVYVSIYTNISSLTWTGIHVTCTSAQKTYKTYQATLWSPITCYLLISSSSRAPPSESRTFPSFNLIKEEAAAAGTEGTGLMRPSYKMRSQNGSFV